MTTLIRHRGIRIITLDAGDDPSACCKPNDIAILPDAAGWWTCFIGEDGSVEKYDIPFSSHHAAMCSAKAAAEFDAQYRL
jgi:hypothetical protein